MSPKDSTDLRNQAYKDLAMRAHGGIFMYLIFWLFTVFLADIINRTPTFFYLNTFLCIALAGIRLVHYLRLKTASDSEIQSIYPWLIGTILFSSLHWGILSAWIIYGGYYQELHYPFMIIIGGFGMAGTLILCISRVASILYPIFIFGPTLLMGLIVGGKENLILVALGVLAILYIYGAARVSRKDYWQAAYSRKEALDKAKQMEKLSITDPLTLLNNRMYFNNRLEEEWMRCIKLGAPMSLFMLDLDHFKTINDTYGHVAGDECLRKIAVVLKSEMESVASTVARYGGEEFVVMFSGEDLAASKKLADNLIRKVSEMEIAWEEEFIPITCSIGLAHDVPSEYTSSKQLLVAADNALYQAKERGRNQYYVADRLTNTVKINQSAASF